MKNAALCFLVLVIVASLVVIPVNSAMRVVPGEDVYTLADTVAKLHFYIEEDEKYHNIFDDQTCVEAFEYMKEFRKRIVLEDDLINITIQFADDFSKTEEFAVKSAQVKKAKSRTSELLARQELNTASKAFHEKCAMKNAEILNEIGAENIHPIGYSPFIELQMEIDKINIYDFINLSKNSRVLHISFAFITSFATEESWNDVTEGIGAYDIIHNGTYTGAGVRIGILEYGGVCDTANANLQGKSIIINNAAKQTSEHATNVTSIISLIAPEAELYVYGFKIGYNLDWFLDNNCSILNCSFGAFGNTINEDNTYNVGPRGYRTDIDGIFDYFTRVHLITVVQAAGNKVTDNEFPEYNPD